MPRTENGGKKDGHATQHKKGKKRQTGVYSWRKNQSDILGSWEKGHV